MQCNNYIVQANYLAAVKTQNASMYANPINMAKQKFLWNKLRNNILCRPFKNVICSKTTALIYCKKSVKLINFKPFLYI